MSRLRPLILVIAVQLVTLSWAIRPCNVSSFQALVNSTVTVRAAQTVRDGAGYPPSGLHPQVAVEWLELAACTLMSLIT